MSGPAGSSTKETVATPSPVVASAATDAAAAPILAVNNIEVVYEHVILVLKGVSLEVPNGEIVALLGANGAGKSTTLKAISNLLSAERGEVTKGSIVFDGEEVHARSPNELVRRGCIQVMEGRHCFAHLSVEENLLTGAFTRREGKAAIRRDIDLVYTYFPRLQERRGSTAGYISGGERGGVNPSGGSAVASFTPPRLDRLRDGRASRCYASAFLALRTAAEGRLSLPLQGRVGTELVAPLCIDLTEARGHGARGRAHSASTTRVNALTAHPYGEFRQASHRLRRR